MSSGRGRRWPFEHICALLRQLIKASPGDFGYQRSRLSTELLAIKINEITVFRLHASTVFRWFPFTGLVWYRAAQETSVISEAAVKTRDYLSPVYSPWVNHVERLWQTLHDTITRNHRCRSMWQLLNKMRHFMKTVGPFPGGKHGQAKV